MVEVARFLPQINLQDLGAHDDIVPTFQVLLLFPILNDRSQESALRVEYDQPRTRLIIDLEEVKLSPQSSVVPLSGLLYNPQILVQLFLCGKPGTVDALEHLVLFIPAPVRPRDTQKFEGLDLPRRRHVGTPAEIDKSPLGIQAHIGNIAGKIVDQLHLVWLAPLFKERNRLFPRHLRAGKGVIGGNNLTHPLFYLFEILGGKGVGIFKIIVETVFYRRPYRHLDTVEDILDRLSHDVRYTVPQNTKPIRGGYINKLYPGIFIHGTAQIHQLTIDLGRHGGLEGVPTSGRDYLPDRFSGLVLPSRTIR